MGRYKYLMTLQGGGGCSNARV